MKLSEMIVIDDAADVVRMSGAKVAGNVFRAFSEPSRPGYWFRVVSVGDVIIIEAKTEDFK